jgi:integrase/recombinase XerD
MTEHYTTAKFGELLQGFFVERLQQQRGVSPETIASYRDTFRLLLQFTQRHLKKSPMQLTMADLDAPLILAFLRHLETERGNSVRTRNARLAALRSFLKYVSLKDIAALAGIQRALAIPMKRFDRPLIGFLSRQEIQLLLNAPPSQTWCGRRDRALLATLYNTGARVSELTRARVADVVLGSSACLHLLGKGRKARTVPLWPATARQLRSWIREVHCAGEQYLFPNRSGQPMTRSNVTDRLRLAVQGAAQHCPQLKSRRISPHVIRHSTAMHLLQSGVDISVIALWLGHASPATTHTYIEADLAMKERALRSIQPPPTKQPRYRPSDRILRFLESL